MKRLSVISVIFLLFGSFIQGQDTQDLLKLSLEDLLNTEIVTASKKPERLFESPLSASVITHKQIKNSGATSIPEILRLAPGLIVREQSPGNFDVHIRGLDNIPPYSEFNESTNSTTLVMINNRVVYNYFAGGTFWESLPIDINSIEKVEIIRGPSAALYGPNAVTGVIHFITRRPEKKGANLVSSFQTGNHRTTLGYQSFKYLRDNFDLTVSANFELRERQTNDYYEFRRSMYVDSPEKLLGYTTGRTTDNIHIRYPDPELAVQKMALNSFFNYRISTDFSIGLNSGYQNSTVQKIFVDTRRTPLTTNDSKTGYLGAVVKYDKLTTQISYLGGEQKTKGSVGWDYHLNTLDINSSYMYEKGNLFLTPGLAYRIAHYGGEFIGGEHEIITSALSLRSEYSFDKLRLIFALRGDKYNHPEDIYFSFQSSALYTFNDNNIIRLVFSRSHRDPFILRSYFNKVILAPKTMIINRGNKNLKLLSMDMYEIGYRCKITPDLILDLEGFYSESKDYSDIFDSFVAGGDSLITILNEYLSTNLKAYQTGMSLNFEYKISKNLMCSIFGTIQKTDIKNFQPLLITDPDSSLNFENEATPDFYGGFNLNYTPYSKWNINLNSYYFSQQTFRHLTGKTKIPEKFLLNSKVSYTVDNKAKVFFIVRNLLDDKSNEFAFADKIGRQFYVGADLSF